VVPPLRPPAPPWHLLAPALIARRWAVLCPPWGPIPCPLPRPVAMGGAGSHLWEVVRSPSLSSSSDDEFANAGEGESPCCSRSRYSSLCCSWRSHLLSFISFALTTRSCSRCCAARSAARARGIGRSDRAAFTITICGQESSRQTRIRQKNPKERRNRAHRLAVGKHHERLEVVVAVQHRFEADRVSRPRGRILQREVLLRQS
jgi:hypothetical protein